VTQPHQASQPYPKASGRGPGFLRRLGPGQRAAVYIGGGTLTLLLLCCGGLTAIGAVFGDPQPGGPAADNQQAPVAEAPAAEAAPTAEPTTPPAPTPAAVPKVEKRTATETRAIPYGTRTVKDSSLPAGTRKVRTKGVNGTKSLTYEVTFTDGVQTSKRLLRESVTRSPVTQVVAVGTKPASSPRCDPNYSGACVPIASDVDCAGGSGNGPAYVDGPVRVIGRDIYDLDRDGDGIGCDT
jgi:hypothetical protein